MEIRLLNTGYKDNKNVYYDFLADKIDVNKPYFSEKSIYISKAPDFPMYLNIRSESLRMGPFLEAFHIMADYYIKLDRDIHFDDVFWHSLLVLEKRDYILKNYPQVKDRYSNFRNVVLKDFDWENYIYKCILAAEYVEDSTTDVEVKNYYYRLIVENLDVYNYLIKSEIFRNGEFILKVLRAIDELGISQIMKAKIPNRPDLGEDERYGRRVIYEFNKEYPVIMTPLLSVEELKTQILKALRIYDIVL